MRRLTIDADALAFAFEDASYEHRWYLDSETGELLMLSNAWGVEDDEELRDAIDGDAVGRYLDLPTAESSEGYRDMEEFIDTVEDDRLQGMLDVAIRGRGAFRRFKDVLLDYPQERDRWFAFQQAQLLDRARRWLIAEGIEPVLTGRGAPSPEMGVNAVDLSTRRSSG